jgi:hypothetical protein
MFAWLDERIRKAEQRSETLKNLNFVCDLKPPADPALIERCEAELQRFLPESYRAFLLLHDGGFVGFEVTLGSMTSSEGFQVFGAADAASATLSLATDLEAFDLPPGALDGLIPFCDYGDSDICLFDARRTSGSEYPVLDGYHEAVGQWREHVIASNFEEWLQRGFDAFIAGRSVVYWVDTPLSAWSERGGGSEG